MSNTRGEQRIILSRSSLRILLSRVYSTYRSGRNNNNMCDYSPGVIGGNNTCIIVWKSLKKDEKKIFVGIIIILLPIPNREQLTINNTIVVCFRVLTGDDRRKGGRALCTRSLYFFFLSLFRPSFVLICVDIISTYTALFFFSSSFYTDKRTRIKSKTKYHTARVNSARTLEGRPVGGGWECRRFHSRPKRW